VTIKNAFNKAELLNLGGGADEEVDLMASLLRSFQTLNIPIDESAIEKFVRVDDENSEEFSHEILDDANEVLHTMQVTNNNEEDESDHEVAEACVHSPETIENDVILVGLSISTIKFLKLMISCSALMCKPKQEMIMMN